MIQYRNPNPNTAQPATACVQYGRWTYGSPPGGGRMKGTTKRKTFAAPKKAAAPTANGEGLVQSGKGRKWRYTIPKEMTALITERGYEIYKHALDFWKADGGRLEEGKKMVTYRVENKIVGIAGRECPDDDGTDEPVCDRSEVREIGVIARSVLRLRDLRRPNPAKGALKGRLLPQNLLNGRIPSRPSSWLTRP